MTFYELPFCNVEDLDYPANCTDDANEDGADVIWVALGAPNTGDIALSRSEALSEKGSDDCPSEPPLSFMAGTDVKRAPHWMVRDASLNSVYRIFSEPKKQLKRCGWIVYTLPGLLYREWRKKKLATNFIR